MCVCLVCVMVPLAPQPLAEAVASLGGERGLRGAGGPERARLVEVEGAGGARGDRPPPQVGRECALGRVLQPRRLAPRVRVHLLPPGRRRRPARHRTCTHARTQHGQNSAK